MASLYTLYEAQEENAVLRVEKVALTNQLAEAKSEIERLEKKVAELEAVLKTLVEGA